MSISNDAAIVKDIEPSTCTTGEENRRSGQADRPSTDEEAEFSSAMKAYQEQSGRRFPTWDEAMAVVNKLGYATESDSSAFEPTKLAKAQFDHPSIDRLTSIAIARYADHHRKREDARRAREAVHKDSEDAIAMRAAVVEVYAKLGTKPPTLKETLQEIEKFGYSPAPDLQWEQETDAERIANAFEVYRVRSGRDSLTLAEVVERFRESEGPPVETVPEDTDGRLAWEISRYRRLTGRGIPTWLELIQLAQDFAR